MKTYLLNILYFNASNYLKYLTQLSCNQIFIRPWPGKHFQKVRKKYDQRKCLWLKLLQGNYIIFLILLIQLITGCTEPISYGLPSEKFHSSPEWSGDNQEHSEMFLTNGDACYACHGDRLDGGQADTSCLQCHHNGGWSETTPHSEGFNENPQTCMGCHGNDLKGGITDVSCDSCHHNGGWSEEKPHFDAFSENPALCDECHGKSNESGSAIDLLCSSCHHEDWIDKNILHGSAYINKPETCRQCHGDDLKGGKSNLSCFSCHHNRGIFNWIYKHGIEFVIYLNRCKGCHGNELNGGPANVSCVSCHHNGGWSENNSHGQAYSTNSDICDGCHGDNTKPSPINLSCRSCHHDNWTNDSVVHGETFKNDPASCKKCHGENLTGGSAKISCFSCHHDSGNSNWEQIHGENFAENPEKCKGCHGDDLNGGFSNISCKTCHHTGWTDTHGVQYASTPENCKSCHDNDLRGGNTLVSCDTCHHSGWNDSHSAEYALNPEGCQQCHGSDLNGGNSLTPCAPCHHGPNNINCLICHNEGVPGSHLLHTTSNNKGPHTPITCPDCHMDGNYTLFGDGSNLEQTVVCNTCHSSEGIFDGANDSEIGAKYNWENGVYSLDGAALIQGKERWCAGCHDDDPATTDKNESAYIDRVCAPNISGDNSVYGFYISGHGKTGIVLECHDCHDFNYNHIDGEARTYTATSNTYAEGFRLNKEMTIPRTSPYDRTQFTLCYFCHDENAIIGPLPEGINPIDPDLIVSNFKNLSVEGFNNGAVPTNNHWTQHLEFNGYFWNSTNGGKALKPSFVSCPACHDPHSSRAYNDQPTISMTRQDMSIVHTSDGAGQFGYMETNDWNSLGGDLQCVGCHASGINYKYYFNIP